MAHDHSTPVSVDPNAVQRAEQGWNAFTKYGKYTIYTVIALLVLMAITLL